MTESHIGKCLKKLFMWGQVFQKMYASICMFIWEFILGSQRFIEHPRSLWEQHRHLRYSVINKNLWNNRWQFEPPYSLTAEKHLKQYPVSQSLQIHWEGRRQNNLPQHHEWSVRLCYGQSQKSGGWNISYWKPKFSNQTNSICCKKIEAKSGYSKVCPVYMPVSSIRSSLLFRQVAV